MKPGTKTHNEIVLRSQRYLDGSWGLEAHETTTRKSHKSNTANDAKLKPGGRRVGGGARRDSVALQRWLENFEK